MGSTAPAAEPAEKWVTKAEASAILKLSTREIERMAQRGRIQKRYARPGAGRRYGCLFYLESDVRAIEEERDLGIHNSGPIPVSTTALSLAAIPQAQTAAVTAQGDAWKALAEHLTHLTRLSHAYPPPAAHQTKAWLTLDEAVDYCGLPAAELERLLREGLIYSFGRGPKTWRIQRAALDAYGAAEHL